MTNKEAIDILRSTHITIGGGDIAHLNYSKAIEKATEALEIAERLKQTITDEQAADCIIVDAECVNNKHDKEVWLNGYNQALADIRGDEE